MSAELVGSDDAVADVEDGAEDVEEDVVEDVEEDGVVDDVARARRCAAGAVVSDGGVVDDAKTGAGRS